MFTLASEREQTTTHRNLTHCYNYVLKNKQREMLSKQVPSIICQNQNHTLVEKQVTDGQIFNQCDLKDAFVKGGRSHSFSLTTHVFHEALGI